MSRKLMTERGLDILGAATVEDFQLRVEAAANDLGFPYFSGTVVLDHSRTVTEFLRIANPPPAYAQAFADPVLAKWDPVSQHCKRSSKLIAWDQETYTSEGLGDCWEHQSAFGYRLCISVAAHLPLGRHFMFGVDGDRPLPRNERARAQLLEDFRILMAHAQHAAFHLLAPETRPAVEGQPLDAMEIEALRWSMDGLPPGEIAGIMNLSDAHLRHHLQNSIVKLACVSKHQAVLKAIRMGLFA